MTHGLHGMRLSGESLNLLVLFIFVGNGWEWGDDHQSYIRLIYIYIYGYNMMTQWFDYYK